MKKPVALFSTIIAMSLAMVVLLAGCGEMTATATGAPTISTSPSTPAPAGLGTGAETLTGLPLVITQPQDNDIIVESTIEVKGNTLPGAVISINEEITTADSQGNFSMTIALDEGPNIIDIVASDESGNQASTSLVVTSTKGG